MLWVSLKIAVRGLPTPIRLSEIRVCNVFSRKRVSEFTVSSFMLQKSRYIAVERQILALELQGLIALEKQILASWHVLCSQLLAFLPTSKFK